MEAVRQEVLRSNPLLVLPARPIRVAGYVLTDTELLEERPTSIDDFREVGAFIKRVYQASAWWAVDWVCIAARSQGAQREIRAAVMEATGYSRKTLYNLRSAGLAVPRDVRRNDIRLSHHIEVAVLSKPGQVVMLEEAVRGGWSVRRLRAEVARRRGAA